MKRITVILVVAVLCIVVPLAALAQASAPVVPTDPSTIIGGILTAFAGKKWAVLVGFVLAGSIFVVRTYLLKGWAWAQTSRGGVVLSLVFGVVGVVAAELIAGQASLMSIVDGVLASWVASGMFSQAKAAATPSMVT